MAFHSREDVRAAAINHGFEADADVFAALARPAWRLSLSAPGASGVPVGESKLGGAPDLAPGESWPRNAQGVPMTFVAQLAPARFPELLDADQPWGHRAELIRLFADLRAQPYESGPALGLSTSSTDLRKIAAPDEPIPPGLQTRDNEDGSVRELPEAAVTTDVVLTLPAVHPAIRDKSNHWMHPLSVPYEDFARTVDPGRTPDPERGSHQVLGWHENGGEDPLAAGPCIEDGYDSHAWSTQPSDWCLLLILHYGPSFDGDPFASPSFYALVIRAADLAVGRYDRLGCDVVY